MIIGFCFAGVLGFLVEICLIKAGIFLGLGAIIPRFVSLPAAIAATFLTNRFISFSNYIPVRGAEIVAYFLAMLVGVLSLLIFLHYQPNHRPFYYKN